MTRKPFKTPHAPAAIGSYSQAVEMKGTVYVSGQIPLDPIIMELVSPDFTRQAHQVFANFAAVLEEAELEWRHVAKLNVFLTDLSQFAIFNEVMSEYLDEPYPARAVVEVSGLPRGAQVEMDGIAHRVR